MKLASTVISLFIASALCVPASVTPVKRAIDKLPGDEDLIDCDGTKFNNFQIEDAAQRAVNNGIDGSGPQPGGYPKKFNNNEGFSFSNCLSGDLAEFPILSTGQVYGGGSPGAYRVIYQETGNKNGRYCGILYHPDDDPSGFEQCS